MGRSCNMKICNRIMIITLWESLSRIFIMVEMKIQDQSAADISHGSRGFQVESSAALHVSSKASFHMPRRNTSLCWLWFPAQLAETSGRYQRFNLTLGVLEEDDLPTSVLRTNPINVWASQPFWKYCYSTESSVDIRLRASSSPSSFGSCFWTLSSYTIELKAPPFDIAVIWNNHLRLVVAYCCESFDSLLL